jgi:methionyl-tRNA synthetase
VPADHPERILVAVAWPYASGPRHIGHVAGFGVPSDIFARYHRLKGSRVLMVSGTDEHGTPITFGADQRGVPPRQFADENNARIVDDLMRLGMTYDIFTRTTTANHHRVVQDVFRTLYDRGYIVVHTTSGAVEPGTGRTLPDRYIEGECPICHYPAARGDQCDNCGNQLDPTDLINPRSRLSGKAPVFRETEHFFLDLPAFGDQLAEWIRGKEGWRPNVRTFSLNFLAELKPRAITRDLDWGVRIPLDGWKERDDKRIYVWFDAVIGYLSASVEWAASRGRPDAWREWWQNPSARHYYFMGKDNIVFHTVIWPSILLGYGEGGQTGAGRGRLELPYEVVSSEFLTMEGRKFSSSRKAYVLVGDFLDRYDADALRYYLAAAGPENQDTDFTWAEFVRRNNDELVGTWGNLVHRTLVNAHRNFGAVPEPGPQREKDRLLVERVERGFAFVGELLDGARFKLAIQETMALAAAVNQYLGDEEPWRRVNEDRARAATVLHTAIRCVDSLKTMFSPFLPFSSQRVHELLGRPGVIAPQPRAATHHEDGREHVVLEGDYQEEPRWRPQPVVAGTRLPPPSPLFRKLDQSVVSEELARMEA